MNDTNTDHQTGGGDDDTCAGDAATKKELDVILDDLCAEIAAAYERANRKWKRLKSEKLLHKWQGLNSER